MKLHCGELASNEIEIERRWLEKKVVGAEFPREQISQERMTAG